MQLHVVARGIVARAHKNLVAALDGADAPFIIVFGAVAGQTDYGDFNPFARLQDNPSHNTALHVDFGDIVGAVRHHADTRIMGPGNRHIEGVKRRDHHHPTRQQN